MNSEEVKNLIKLGNAVFNYFLEKSLYSKIIYLLASIFFLLGAKKETWLLWYY